MKLRLLCWLVFAALAGCASLPFQTPATDDLHAAYQAMQAAVAIDADRYAAPEMQDARERYVEAWGMKDRAPGPASRLAQQSQVLAELATAKAQAALAAQQRQAAQAELSTLQQMARPPGGPR
jgi:hypothetical protein